jgi:hypothetical protein
VLREVEEYDTRGRLLMDEWRNNARRLARELRSLAPLLRHHADVIQAILRMSAGGYIPDANAYDEECCRARALADELEAR